MLTLQRASAGSGKTYTLAKKFLWFLLTVKPEGKKRRLRSGRELADAASHILAVTFTNKATNEMKQRIVDKLAALAGACAPDRDPLRADYMKEFCETLGVTPQQVSEAASAALNALLNDYGDFHVSTIDSFFQTVLRTFAYETELNDAYAVEIDSKYVARMGMDAMLDEIDGPEPTEETAYWIEFIMSRAVEAGKNWNVFQRRQAAGSIYRQLVSVVERMEKEDFKIKRAALDAWFDAHPDFRRVYADLEQRFETPVREAHARMQEAARSVARLFPEHGADITVHAHRYLAGHVSKTLAVAWDGPQGGAYDFKPIDITKSSLLKVKKTEYPHLKGSPLEESLLREVGSMYEARQRWMDLLTQGDTGLWIIYRRTLPYLGLLRSVRRHIREFLEDNNTVELGETNSLLRRIIGPDDTPFVYERLGTRLNHFLIDEFQDTSRLQWENLYPLLAESEARGHDNLIIGDAKQSIYRFRNADPSLITSVVPEAFPGHEAAGMSAADNTNWRSALRIVRFNNYFFRHLADGLDEEMGALYANTVQLSRHREPRGYVEINLFSDKGDDNEIPPHFHDMGPLVADMRRRGYRQRDIAFLVATHGHEQQIMDALMDYNDNLPAGEPPVDFISEQSLTLGASEAVRLVISALETVCEGTRPEIRTGKERRKRGVADWQRIRCSFNFFAMRHPDLPPARQLELFLESPGSADPLSDMLSSMQAVALPALVEAIVENFVPAPLRDADTPYLAALQDAVADYCQAWPADIASFLDWWERKGRHSAISFPEETDAVRVMTIHKSKGLEFKCVVVPYAKQRFTPLARETEWTWVAPAFSEESGLRGGSPQDPVPPYLPVDTDTSLEGTPHADSLARYRYLYRMDKLNSVYVAFTRAVDELYVFAPVNLDRKTGEVKDDDSTGSWLHTLCSQVDQLTAGPEEEMPAAGEMVSDSKGLRFTYGSRADMGAARSDSPASGGQRELIREYFVNSGQSFLTYTESDTPAASGEEDEDPRSEGNLLHAAMAEIRTAADIPRAVRRLHVQGLLSYRRMEEMMRFLQEALTSVEPYGWFTLPGEGGWSVANERPVISARSGDSRPDRLLISPDGRHAIVIDYKFGEVHTDNRYRRQVRRYMDVLMRTGRFASVRGCLWYVRAGTVEEISPA
ncbi:MAG: UvrD-helicase domain-containing protein [Muribaculaceae bacterium]|nr:UvrD-helicase domain-containing protein [Muribaculaceae bacterium]